MVRLQAFLQNSDKCFATATGNGTDPSYKNSGRPLGIILTNSKFIVLNKDAGKEDSKTAHKL